MREQQGVVASAASDWGLDLATYPMTIMIGPTCINLSHHDHYPACPMAIMIGQTQLDLSHPDPAHPMTITIGPTLCQGEEVWPLQLLASGPPEWDQGDKSLEV